MRRKGKGTRPGPRPGPREGQGAGQAGRRQGAGQGTEGRAGLQDFHFDVYLKNHVFAIFEKKGEGRAGQGLGSERLGAGQHRARAKARARAKGRKGAGRVQGQSTEGMQDVHFEVFKA